MKSYRNSETAPPIMQGSPPTMVLPFANWDRPPWNRWAFQHIREIMPTVEVWRGTGPVRALPRAERDLDGLEVTLPGGGQGSLAELLDQTYTDGFIVLKDDAVAYERYFNGMGARSLHLSQSVAKTVVGTAAGIIVGRGLLDPEALVTEYLPELATTGWRGAKLRHVLDMTTGVRFDETYTDPHSDIGQVDVASGWKPPPPDADPDFPWPAHVWELILRLTETTRPHGECFVYRSIESDVLAFCMERVTGCRLAQIVSEEVWQKMGAEESASFTIDPAGYALAEGGFNATLRDYARLGQLWLDQTLVPPEWVADSRRRNDAIYPERAEYSLPGGAYRNTIWNAGNGDVLLARGVFGQMIYIDFANRLVAVKLSTWPDFMDPALESAARGAIKSIARALE